MLHGSIAEAYIVQVQKLPHVNGNSATELHTADLNGAKQQN